ncbi:MAG: hydantoinase B/oxoprolinase family protein [Alicyclobacillus sp.]|nr:hydantoinase B/oxoprolinase family protein [Alicyclobacillus sp.]
MTEPKMLDPEPAVPDHDPIRAEVLQMRLKNIVDEMATTLIHTSGSPVLTEAKDFSTAIFDHKKEHVAFAGYVTTHLGSSLVGVRSIPRYYDEDSLRPGDHFILNDPHTAGALHQGDVAIISPLFFRNELVGWAFSNAHILDVGGMSPGGWAPEARDLYSEALRFVPTRIVREGRFSYELFNLIRNNVRLPEPVVNDIKSLIAANNVCQQRIEETIERFGLDAYRHYCDVNKRLSETMLRKRIQAIPNGRYLGEDWVEYDGHGEDLLVKVACELTVEDADLRVDFSGSDPQVDAFVNAGEGMMVGIVASEIIMTLAWDIPVNAGVLRPFHLVLGSSGLVVNPTVPAPVSCGHMEAGSKAGRAVREALVRALELCTDERLRSRISAAGTYSWPGNSWVGLDQFGKYTAFAVLDCGSCGMGAQSCHDGLDISSYEVNLDNSIPDVEINEGLYPMLYLWRSIHTDSGGPGYYRGGQGIDLAWIPYDTDSLNGTLENACAQFPSRGVLGGYPGATNAYLLYRDCDVPAFLSRHGKLPDKEEVSGYPTRVRNHLGHLPITSRDMFRLKTGGGGGYGDPLARDPHWVALDVRNGFITRLAAQRAYGVVLTGDGRVDEAATADTRAGIRADRIGKSPADCVEGRVRFGVLRAGSNWFCAQCESGLGSEESPATVSKRFDLANRLAEFGIEVEPRAVRRPVLVESYCPACGCLLNASIALPPGPETATARPQE